MVDRIISFETKLRNLLMLGSVAGVAGAVGEPRVGDSTSIINMPLARLLI